MDIMPRHITGQRVLLLANYVRPHAQSAPYCLRNWHPRSSIPIVDCGVTFRWPRPGLGATSVIWLTTLPFKADNQDIAKGTWNNDLTPQEKQTLAC